MVTFRDPLTSSIYNNKNLKRKRAAASRSPRSNHCSAKGSSEVGSNGPAPKKSYNKRIQVPTHESLLYVHVILFIG